MSTGITVEMNEADATSLVAGLYGRDKENRIEEILRAHVRKSVETLAFAKVFFDPP